MFFLLLAVHLFNLGNDFVYWNAICFLPFQVSKQEALNYLLLFQKVLLLLLKVFQQTTAVAQVGWSKMSSCSK